MSDWQAIRDTLGLQIRPIDVWPGKRHSPVTSPFSAPLKHTLQTLKRELRELRAKNIVLQVAFKPAHLRMDGLPRSGATAEHPGVILSFDCRHGSLRLYADRFTRWDYNLRAIADHLEHLRHAGLYGVGEDGQQYQGWAQLPAGTGGGDPIQDAARLIAEYAPDEDPAVLAMEIVRQPNTFVSCYRNAVRHAHPDVGGSHDEFLRLEQAAELIRKHHGERTATR